MSDKLSINIEILGVSMIHNFLVPDDMVISKVIELVLKMLKEEYPDIQNNNTQHILIQSNTGKALGEEYDLKQLGIVNGENLILM